MSGPPLPVRLLAAAGLFGASLLVLGGCRQASGIAERTPCEDPFATTSPTACERCAAESCCEALIECRGEACGTLDACLALCAGDGACAASCREQHASGFDEDFASLASCRASACAEACGLACGGYTFPTEACGACAESACCAEASSCASDRDCLALAHCQRACGRDDAPCEEACALLHVAGVERARTFGACLARSCGGACYGGADWSCVGEPPPSVGPGLDPSLTVVVYDVGSLPVRDEIVESCPTPAACGSPAGVTDASGRVGLLLPRGFTGYLRLAAAPSVLPRLTTWLYIREPLIDDRTVYVPAYTRESFEGLYGEVAPGKGHLVLSVLDCGGAQPPGLVFSLDDPSAVPFYGLLGEISGTATVSGNAGGGFLDLTPAEHALVIRRSDTDGCVASDTVHVSADALTFAVDLRPGGCSP